MLDRASSRLVAVVGLVTIALALAACGGGRDGAGEAEAGGASTGLVDIGAGLQGPEGLWATVYAQGLPNVSALAFDAEGRLWAATAAFSPNGTDAVYLVPKPGAAPIKVIEDVSTVMGLLWHEGELYVSSQEIVEAYGGFDGARFDGVRTVVSFPQGVGELNGIAVSPSGRFAVGISAPCNACEPSSDYSGAVVSFLADGSDLRVDAANIRAPIGLAYYPGSSDLFVTMNQRDDLGDATPGDWLAVVKPGQDWRFPGCYGQGGSACSGVPAPIAELDEHAAVSGIAIVTGQLGASLANSVFVAEWKTGVVLRVAIEPKGNGYTGNVQPFLDGPSNPVPVALSPDGALFVGDWTTGIVYRIAKA